MIQELVYTSYVGEGLRAGSGGGFCTVLCSQGMSSNIVRRLEQLSGYKHSFDMHDSRSRQNPILFRSIQQSIGGVKYNILSRVADCGSDYSGRTNKFAHHLILANEDQVAGGPTQVLKHSKAVRDSWDEVVREELPFDNSQFPQADSKPVPCRAWKSASGDAGWAGFVAEKLCNLSKPTDSVSIIFPLGTDCLSLANEVFGLVPQSKRWGISFCTHSSDAAHTQCNLNFILDETSQASLARRDRRKLVLDLSEKMGSPNESEWVNAARNGDLANLNIFDYSVAATGTTARRSFRRSQVRDADKPQELARDDYQIMPPELMPSKSSPPAVKPSAQPKRNVSPIPVVASAGTNGQNWTLGIGIAAIFFLMLLCIASSAAFYFLGRFNNPPTYSDLDPSSEDVGYKRSDSDPDNPSVSTQEPGASDPTPATIGATSSNDGEPAGGGDGASEPAADEPVDNDDSEPTVASSSSDNGSTSSKNGADVRSLDTKISDPSSTDSKIGSGDTTNGKSDPVDNSVAEYKLEAPTDVDLPTWEQWQRMDEPRSYDVWQVPVGREQDFELELLGLKSLSTKISFKPSPGEEKAWEVLLHWGDDDEFDEPYSIGQFFVEDSMLKFKWVTSSLRIFDNTDQSLLKSSIAIRWCLLKVSFPEQSVSFPLSQPIAPEFVLDLPRTDKAPIKLEIENRGNFAKNIFRYGFKMAEGPETNRGNVRVEMQLLEAAGFVLKCSLQSGRNSGLEFFRIKASIKGSGGGPGNVVTSYTIPGSRRELPDLSEKSVGKALKNFLNPNGFGQFRRKSGGSDSVLQLLKAYRSALKESKEPQEKELREVDLCIARYQGIQKLKGNLVSVNVSILIKHQDAGSPVVLVGSGGRD